MVAATGPIHPSYLIYLAVAIAVFPTVVMLCTSYLKVSVVLNILKIGLGLPQGQNVAIEGSLALAITCLVMSPIAEDSILKLSVVELDPPSVPVTESTFTKLMPALEPWRVFLTRFSGPAEVAALSELSGVRKVESSGGGSAEGRPPIRVLFTAFILSELKAAMLMGFMVLLPFLLIDLAVSILLTGVGLTMVNPTSISLPIKLLLFYYVDGWLVLTQGLVTSYQAGTGV